MTILVGSKALRRHIRRLARDLAAAESVNAATQHLIRCTDPAMHIRLAARLEQAETVLADLTGVDPHTASLEKP
jgi:hypothetical protein